MSCSLCRPVSRLDPSSVAEMKYPPAIAFCSTFSVLGASASVTTPSILSAMVVALCEYWKEKEGAAREIGEVGLGLVGCCGGSRRKLQLLLTHLSENRKCELRDVGRALFTPASFLHNRICTQSVFVMALLDAHLEQISLCATSIAELPYVHCNLLYPSRLIGTSFAPPKIFTNALLQNHDITSLIRDTELHERALFLGSSTTSTSQARGSCHNCKSTQHHLQPWWRRLKYFWRRGQMQ